MKQITIFFVVSFLANITFGADFLTEKPDYLPRACSMKDANFNACTVRSLQSIYDKAEEGIPGLKTLQKFDPYFIKKIRLEQDDARAKFDIQLTNITAKGFGNVMIKDNHVEEKDFTWKTKLFVPHLVVDGNYKVNGKILSVSLKGHGKLFLELDKIDLKLITKIKLFDRGGFTFSNVTSSRVDFKIGGLKIKLDNLFNGQRDVEDSVNNLFNENWKEFLEAMRPALNAMLESILLDNMKQVFNYIPTKFFVTDIQDSKKYYA